MPSFAPLAYVPPPTDPVPAIQAVLAPAAGKAYSHAPGATARGSTATYSALRTYLWYGRGGWLTLNRGRRGIRRTCHGNEDTSQIRR